MGSLMQTPHASINATLEYLESRGVTQADWNRCRQACAGDWVSKMVKLWRFGVDGEIRPWRELDSDDTPERELGAALQKRGFMLSGALEKLFLSAGRNPTVTIGYTVGLTSAEELGFKKTEPLPDIGELRKRVMALGHECLPLRFSALTLLNRSIAAEERHCICTERPMPDFVYMLMSDTSCGGALMVQKFPPHGILIEHVSDLKVPERGDMIALGLNVVLLEKWHIKSA